MPQLAWTARIQASMDSTDPRQAWTAQIHCLNIIKIISKFTDNIDINNHLLTILHLSQNM